ncbi:siderophore-interacting protein [Streptomyces sp. RG38]|uniref:Siderophore-interacting protein n=2 Tax=Streptomyces tagetis TaxID=2820809 RepID=A0A940XJ69_9ACTN|nr:siderophore-interacting protein [Streptomyces sp. RG38]
MVTLTVRRQERIGPHFVSLTLAGDDVRHLERSGYDQAGRLFFSGPGQDDVALPTGERWMLAHALLPAGRRPRVRTYTVRRFAPDLSSFDIEVSLRSPDGPGGPGNAWALAARPGDRVAFLDEGSRYAPAPGAGWQLLAGDESAVPAALAVLESSAAAGGPPAEVFLEVPADEDVRAVRPGVTAPEGTRVHWLPRNDPALRPGTLALRAVREATLPSGPCSAWAAGESALATGVRRHLVGERGVPRAAVTFRGYWRHGRAAL